MAALSKHEEVGMTIATGTRLGPYEITASIGAGGMGEVYRARDTRLERSVAVKILPTEFAVNAQLRIRFEREAKVVSSLNHPNICTVHDVGETNGFHYLVMEYLEGETLAQRLARGALPIDQVLTIGSQIAAALDKAHRQGIVHRDLKPGNIMLTKSGAKLLDFGLAKTQEIVGVSSPRSDSEFANDATHQRALTQEGTILGTFQYMSPEQLDGVEADPRSDIFAFGTVLYEMVTGKRAFEGKTKTSLIAAIVQGRPAPVSQLQPLTPPALDRLIESCLEKNPEDRIQTAHDVLLQLRWIAEGGSEAGIAAPVIKRRRLQERLRWTIALVVVAATATFAGWKIPRTEVKPSYSFTIPPNDGHYRAGTTFSAISMISPDGSRVFFYAYDAEGKVQLWIRRLDSLDAKPVALIEGNSHASWSPDSKSLVFVSGTKLLKIPADGGPAQPVADMARPGAFAVAPDGTILYGPGESALVRIDPKTGTSREITTIDRSAHEISHTLPEILPDGRTFLFIATTRNPGRTESAHRLYAGNLDKSEVKFIAEISSLVRYVGSGHLLFVRDGVLLAQEFEVDTLTFTGEPRTLLEDVFYFKPTGSAAFSVSRNGILTARAPVKASRLYVVSADGKEKKAVGKAASFGSLTVAPDGKRILLGIADAKVGTMDLWVNGLDRETAQRLTFDSGWENHGVWSPDGAKIYYSSDQGGVPDIYEKVIDGSGADELLVEAPGTQFPKDITPDGKFLLYQTTEDPRTQGDLFVVPLDGERKPRPFVKLPFSQGSSARFSPDGRLVAYSSSESGTAEMYVKPFPGPGPSRQISTRGGGFGRWSRDGRRLYFFEKRTLMVVDIAADSGAPSGEPRKMFEVDHDVVSFELAPEGEQFLMVLNTEENSVPPTRVYVNWERLLKQ